MTASSSVPQSLEDAIELAKQATLEALDTGYGRLQIEIVVPEIALRAEAIAREFVGLFEDEYGTALKVVFPDAGAAALARRNWGDLSCRVVDLGSRVTPVEKKVAEEDRIFLLVCPSAVEIQKVEKLCNLAGDRPVILLIPQLEDVSIVGIGYAARQLRDRFLSTLESIFYLQPMEGAALYRCFPAPWQVWREETEGGALELLVERAEKPIGEALDRILNPVSVANATATDAAQDTTTKAKKNSGLLGELQKFLRALSS
ncbi:MAG: DUF1995 family protein [Cyanobacteria bacterium J06641_5]